MNPTKKQLQEKYGDEQVFVVPMLSAQHIADKFSEARQCLQCNDDLLTLQEWDAKGRYVFRHDAEYNEALQQLIPYVLITDVTGEKFYISRRIAGDARLTGALSLGFGGHINPIDGTTNVIMNGFERELNEEVFIKRKKAPVEFLGYVRDLNSPTKEHIGLVMMVKARYVKIKEENVLEGLWMTLPELVDNYHKFESWAKHIIDYLFITRQKKLA